MRVHIMPDDKFMDAFIENSEKASEAGDNVYFVRVKPPFQYISFSKVKPIRLDSAEWDDLVHSLGPTDEIYMHQLGTDEAAWLARAESVKASVCWLFWGQEFFQFIEDDIYGAYTLPYVQKAKREKEQVINATRFSRWLVLNEWRRYKRIKRARQVKESIFSNYQKAVKKVDVFMHYNPLDFEWVCSVFPTKARFQYFYYTPAMSYVDVAKFVAENTTPLPVDPGKLNVWIANSASPSSNHKDAVMKIKDIEGLNPQLWLPANYGDADYLEFLKNEVQPLMPDNCTLITEFMSYGYFSATIAAMDVAILWHIRAQAFGNAALLFFLEKKVFMHPKSTLYKMLKELGYHIWSVDEISAATLTEPLSKQAATENKEKIAAQFSKEGSGQTILNAYKGIDGRSGL